MKVLLFLFTFSSPIWVFAKSGSETVEEKTIPLGNFSLPVSQQPSPLISFGETIVNQGDVQAFFFADAFVGENNLYSDLVPSLVYGLKDNLSLLLTVPFAPFNAYGGSTSSGIEDVSIQLEYAFYSQGSALYQNQATCVGAVTFPSGSKTENPSTSWGKTAYFVGATFNHMRERWFFFTSYGAWIPTSYDHGTRFGYELLYQAGGGRNIPSPRGWIFAWLLEMDGTYYFQDRIRGAINPNSGGNVIYLTPSFWASSKKWLFQAGVSVPCLQSWRGSQLSEYVVFSWNMAYLF